MVSFPWRDAQSMTELEKEDKQSFLNLVLEAADTGDRSKVIAWWRDKFPGYKWWCFNPNFQFVLSDDGEDSCMMSAGSRTG